MDSQASLEIDTQGLWRGLTCYFSTMDQDHERKTTFPGFGYVTNTYSDSSKMAHHEDFELPKTGEMDTFLTTLAQSGHSSSSSASPTTSYDQNSHGTPPPLVKGSGSSTSDSSSSLPEVLMDIPGERRRAQNRAAQRSHRDRQKRYVTQLEKRYFALQSSYQQLDEKCKAVQRKYESLLSFVQCQQTPMDSPPFQSNNEVPIYFPSSDLHTFNEFSLSEQELDRVLAFRLDETSSPKCGFFGD